MLNFKQSDRDFQSVDRTMKPVVAPIIILLVTITIGEKP
jgi:hypothetical protein